DQCPVRIQEDHRNAGDPGAALVAIQHGDPDGAAVRRDAAIVARGNAGVALRRAGAVATADAAGNHSEVEQVPHAAEPGPRTLIGDQHRAPDRWNEAEPRGVERSLSRTCPPGSKLRGCDRPSKRRNFFERWWVSRSVDAYVREPLQPACCGARRTSVAG